MPTYLLYLSIVVPTILISLGIALYVFQERLIFHPETLSNIFEFKFDQPFEEINYTTDDGNMINALLFKVDNPRGIVYYHHGNADNLIYWGARAVDFTSKGYNILMYDYRGFGKSSGKIKNERMIFSDALMIYKRLLYDYKERDIILYGTSLGTGIAARLANENNPKILILETPYFNFYDVSKYHYPYLPNSILLHYQFKINKHLPEIKIPIFLFHGTEDLTVPYNSSERLVKLSKHATLITIQNGSHNNLNSFALYHEKLDEILNN